MVATRRHERAHPHPHKGGFPGCFVAICHRGHRCGAHRPVRRDAPCTATKAAAAGAGGGSDPYWQDRSGTAQMTLALRYAVRSDVGLLREGNEHSAYAGPHLLAVADGMGGHAAGEVASAATITTIADLDADQPASELLGALANAVA